MDDNDGRLEVDSVRTSRSQRSARPQKVAFILAQQIVDEIVGGDLRPGSRLGSETDLIERYGVSRGTLREALRVLELQGVLTAVSGPRGGLAVARPDGRHFAALLGLHLAVSRTTFREVLQTLELIAPRVAREAALNADSDSIARMRSALERMAARADETDDRFWSDFDDLFAEIHAGSGNTILAVFMGSLRGLIDGRRAGVSYPAGWGQKTMQYFTRIVDAIADRDPERAESAMAESEMVWRRYLERHYARLLDRPLRWRT